jgi:RimJ/RimL family protein N-acetyltransferase
MWDASQISFRKMQIADVRRVMGWLNQEHVKRWWYGDIDVTYAEVYREHVPKLTGKIPTTSYIIGCDSMPVGYIETYLIPSWPDYAQRVDVDELSASLDMFIGEAAYLHQGLGPLVLRKFLREKVFTRGDVISCIVGPEPENAPAIRAAEKVGFTYLKTIPAVEGEHAEYLMRITPDGLI